MPLASAGDDIIFVMGGNGALRNAIKKVLFHLLANVLWNEKVEPVLAYDLLLFPSSESEEEVIADRNISFYVETNGEHADVFQHFTKTTDGFP